MKLRQILQGLVLAQWFAAILWFAMSWQRGCASIGVIGALVIVLIQAPFIAFEFVMMRRCNQDGPHPLPHASALCRIWIAEVATSMAVFSWRQPFRSNRHADHLGEADRGRRGVVLIHGFLCNRGVWNPWRPRLRELKIPCIALNLEPVLTSIDDHGVTIDAAVRAMHESTGRPPILVAHSMGGLAARAWLRSHGAIDRVHRIVTIGTPHRGTWMARSGFAANVRQMRLRSPWCAALAANETRATYGRFTCFYGHCDNVVFPRDTATLPGADNRHLHGVGHLQLLQHPQVFAEVVRQACE